MTILIAVDALICERSVTKAAKRVRVGQPSMGHLLATLSVLLRDELVVLVSHSVSPNDISFCFTNGSPKLREPSKGAVRVSPALERAIEKRMFQLGFASDLELALMPLPIAVLRSKAPGRASGRSFGRSTRCKMCP